MGEFYHLNLMELVLTDNAAGITASRTGFSTEAWAEGAMLDRQILCTQNFIAIIVGYRYFGSWNQVVV